MEFKELALYLAILERTSSRLEITRILSELYKKLTPQETDKTTYLLLGSLSASFDEKVFNIAEKMVIKAVALAFDSTTEEVTRDYKKMGDLGEAAYEIAKTNLSNVTLAKLTIQDTFSKLLTIAEYEGEGSQEKKISGLAELLKQFDPLSTKFIVRIPVGKLRLGFSEKTIIDALSFMEAGDKSKRLQLENAYNVLPDVGLLARFVKEKGIEATAKNITPVLGVPLLPMLAQRIKSPAEMIEKMKEVSIEPKFDGLRIQIHFKADGFTGGKTVKAFTRNLNEVSWMFPELEKLAIQVKAKEAIFDSEAIGVNKELKTLANFQTTMSRRRKHDIEKIAKNVSIKFYVFDLMFRDGKSLIQNTYVQRRKELEKTIKKGKILEIVEFIKTIDPGDITRLMSTYKKDGLEGIIVKRFDSDYFAGRTGFRWVKMKEAEDSIAKLVDTVDPVVMGYYAGRGKRNTFGMGGFLVGIMDRGTIKTLTKIGTGLSDDQFRELKERLAKFEVSEKPKEYGEVHKTLIPDVWVAPSLIVEIAADEITQSPNHSSGYALRFPRLVKFRDDKKYTQGTDLEELKELFKLQ